MQPTAEELLHAVMTHATVSSRVDTVKPQECLTIYVIWKLCLWYFAQQVWRWWPQAPVSLEVVALVVRMRKVLGPASLACCSMHARDSYACC